MLRGHPGGVSGVRTEQFLGETPGPAPLAPAVSPVPAGPHAQPPDLQSTPCSPRNRHPASPRLGNVANPSFPVNCFWSHSGVLSMKVLGQSGPPQDPPLPPGSPNRPCPTPAQCRVSQPPLALSSLELLLTLGSASVCLCPGWCREAGGVQGPKEGGKGRVCTRPHPAQSHRLHIFVTL